MTDAAGNVTRYVYDDHGRLTRETSPRGHATHLHGARQLRPRTLLARPAEQRHRAHARRARAAHGADRQLRARDADRVRRAGPPAHDEADLGRARQRRRGHRDGVLRGRPGPPRNQPQRRRHRAGAGRPQSRDRDAHHAGAGGGPAGRVHPIRRQRQPGGRDRPPRSETAECLRCAEPLASRGGALRSGPRASGRGGDVRVRRRRQQDVRDRRGRPAHRLRVRRALSAEAEAAAGVRRVGPLLRGDAARSGRQRPHGARRQRPPDPVHVRPAEPRHPHRRTRRATSAPSCTTTPRGRTSTSARSTTRRAGCGAASSTTS